MTFKFRYKFKFAFEFEFKFKFKFKLTFTFILHSNLDSKYKYKSKPPNKFKLFEENFFLILCMLYKKTKLLLTEKIVRGSTNIATTNVCKVNAISLHSR